MGSLTIPDTRLQRLRKGDEKAVLLSHLNWYRQTVLLTLDGLESTSLTRQVDLSTTTLLGIVNHLVCVERGWFRQAFMNEDVGDLWPSNGEQHRKLRNNDADGPEALVSIYRDEIDRANHICATASLEDVARNPKYVDCTLRIIVIHMIEETARQAGRAELLREIMDGLGGS